MDFLTFLIAIPIGARCALHVLFTPDEKPQPAESKFSKAVSGWLTDKIFGKGRSVPAACKPSSSSNP